MDEKPLHPLAAAREALGLNRVQFAERIQAAAKRRGLRSGVTNTRVRKWEVDSVEPDDLSQEYIAEALEVDAPGPASAPWPHWLPGAGGRDRPHGGVVELGSTTTVPALREALQATMDRSRRVVVSAISSTALLGLAGAWAHAEPHPPASKGGQIAPLAPGDDLLTSLEQATNLFTSQPTEARQHTAHVLTALLTSVSDLLEEGHHRGEARRRLHVLAAKLSQELGWHRFDTYRHEEAARYWIGGLHSAHALGDSDLGAGILSDLAYQASWRNRPEIAAHILRRALTRTRHPAAQSLLQLRLARALAVRGERGATLRALAAADHLLGAPCADPVPDWCKWMSTADLAVDSGQALLDLGDTRRAHQLIREGQAALPAARIKTYGVFQIYQARSYLELGEPEQAAAAATEALDLALRIGAPRCVQLVRELTPRFGHFPTAEGVPELLARTAA
ncbi:multiprotein-bridging factor 1 family protein [Streptomyces microflavus]|uniref:helix-turn-helix domain-containing protein n=1 Tax=Streptomyces microflavus TaxID=1919 RepID=UPI0037FBC809